MAAMDLKQELNHFLQKHCKRPLTKTDIVYTTSKYGMQYQAIVKLNCLGGQEYAGHLMQDGKAAEKSAAEQALAANAAAVQAVKAEAAAGGSKKRQAPKVLTPEERAAKQAKKASGEAAPNPAQTPKTELNSLLMRIVKRYLQKGETIYTTNKIGMQYQATVQLTCLPEEWGTRAWAGHLSANKQQAEQNAAEQALKDIKGDEKLAAAAAQPKGRGKGKAQYMEMMMEMMQSWGWTWGEDGMPREKVAEGKEFVGTVLEWKGHYGWLKTEETIEHEAKDHRDGKIYVNKKDIVGEVESLTEGQVVKFKLFVDPSGLGAEECTPV